MIDLNGKLNAEMRFHTAILRFETIHYLSKQFQQKLAL